MSELSHVDGAGRARMVDVSAKSESTRIAVAAGELRTTAEVVALVRADDMPKADVLPTARIAGIMAAKKTSELIPLCHQLALSSVKVEFGFTDTSITIEASAKTRGQTGVEMEALTAVAVAGLTLHDMVKAVDPAAVLNGVRLLTKEGGKHGHWERPEENGGGAVAVGEVESDDATVGSRRLAVDSGHTAIDVGDAADETRYDTIGSGDATDGARNAPIVSGEATGETRNATVGSGDATAESGDPLVQLHEAHRRDPDSPEAGSAVVLVASTGAAAGTREDTTGPVLVDWLAGLGFSVRGPLVYADADISFGLADALRFEPDLVISTGGTGASPTDGTPEATLSLLDRELPGVAEAIRRRGTEKFPLAALSRGVAGLAGRSVVVNLPGSPGGVKDGIAVLEPLLDHLLAQVAGGGNHE
ncbi:bifunctional molybdenum cofactor biosynthesis protein MoaC/MoaB [Nocardia goodfellowii]|uniref:Cyclic pyranopterin monophosphate synthase n=1 Tax=Nocardia goodfellowii TaxID=882446 RepID=A0ABS4QGK8_9NOCA|nr:bifunctional molybdenum cofactor biosynthesis protein MoaC/MoaB [Nocardia goodfellowii]MBP2189806.1 cyclic pyranopterin phosphate synthase [Nocardia goodfellowii]